SDITLTESFSDEPSEETNDPTTVTLDISDFAGSIAYIAIRHYNSYDADYLSIDDLTITSETEMSVSNFENAQLSHFNTNETLNVNSSLDLETLEIYSILGKKVGSEILNGNSASINIAHLQKGVYLAKVSAEGQTKTFKFIKK
uniref:T9SS type A sorting domain-containing protein n=1 Tax=Mesonia mobilis TaxID=369791 RepID=UPI0026EF05E0